MGYYTRYNLKADCERKTFFLIVKEFRDKNEDVFYILNDDGSSEEPTKWYSSIEDLSKLSKNYPNIIFTLSGEGEETGDLWKCYFKNGKCQQELAKITYGKYDETKLEEYNY